MTTRTKPPTDNFPRVFRGGSWCRATAANVRAAFRLVSAPSLRDYSFGFRCAQRGCRQVLKGVISP